VEVLNRAALGRCCWELFPDLELAARDNMSALGLDAHNVRSSMFGLTCELMSLDLKINYEYRREAFGWLGVYDFLSGEGASVRSQVMEAWRSDPANVFEVPVGAAEIARSFPYGPCELRWLAQNPLYVNLTVNSATNCNRVTGLRFLDLLQGCGFTLGFESIQNSETLCELLRLAGIDNRNITVVRGEAESRKYLAFVKRMRYYDIIAAYAFSSISGFLFTVNICRAGDILRFDHIFSSITPWYRLNHSKLLRDFGVYNSPGSFEEYVACLVANLSIYGALVKRGGAFDSECV
jgi:hypothetical protein